MRIRPPWLAVLYLLAAFGLQALVPGLTVIPAPFHLLGLLLVGAGPVFAVWSILLFKKRGTPIDPHGTPTALVVTGPFRLSRSPMYLGLTAVLLGIAVYVGTLPWFLAPLAFALTMHVAYIPHEEATLERLFGQEYLDYKNRVRRWL